MKTETIIEIIGYTGSALVLVSFLMTSVAKLRIVNMIGSIIFMTYALIIRSYPTAIMNFCLVLINLHFLWKMRNTGNEYELVCIDKNDSYLKYLLKRYEDDIVNCFPGIGLNAENAAENVNRAYLISCKGAPVGITLGRASKDASVKDASGRDFETMELLLDYSVPEFRDFSIGTFMMNHLKKEGVDCLTYSGPTENHMPYLNKMGFVNNNGIFIKDLA